MGGNVGDSRTILSSAFHALVRCLAGARLSSFYRTAPRYLENQTPFLNAAVAGYTALEPLDLLREIQGIEAEFGRDRTKEIPKGPRTLDIDILLYGSRIIELPSLTVPHPGLCERSFALVPLLELEPRLMDPSSGRSYADIQRGLVDQGIYLEARSGL